MQGAVGMIAERFAFSLVVFEGYYANCVPCLRVQVVEKTIALVIFEGADDYQFAFQVVAPNGAVGFAIRAYEHLFDA